MPPFKLSHPWDYTSFFLFLTCGIFHVLSMGPYLFPAFLFVGFFMFCPWDYTSFLLFLFAGFFLSVHGIIPLFCFFACRTSSFFLSAFIFSADDDAIVPYLNASSDTNRGFHEVECHAISPVERKNRMRLSVRWTVPPFLSIVLGEYFQFPVDCTSFSD